jgi:hypothetical protein
MHGLCAPWSTLTDEDRRSCGPGAVRTPRHCRPYRRAIVGWGEAPGVRERAPALGARERCGVMYPELKPLGLHLVAKVIGFQKPCLSRSSQNGPRGRMNNQDRLAHPKVYCPIRQAQGARSLAPVGSPHLACPARLRTSARSSVPPPRLTGTIVGVSTHDSASSLGRKLSCFSTEQRGRQMRAEAPNKGSMLPSRAEAPGLPCVKAVFA